MGYATFWGFWLAWFGSLGAFVTQVHGHWLLLLLLWFPVSIAFYLWHDGKFD